MTNRVVEAKRHALRGPRDKVLYLLHESLLHRLHRLPTFLFPGKVKGTPYRVARAKKHDLCDPRDKFSKYPHELIYFAIHYCIGKVFSKKNWSIPYQKCHIYIARRRYSTSYCSINFTIWLATILVSSTYLTN